jgi:hypothetical protein
MFENMLTAHHTPSLEGHFAATACDVLTIRAETRDESTSDGDRTCGPEQTRKDITSRGRSLR